MWSVFGIDSEDVKTMVVEVVLVCIFLSTLFFFVFFYIYVVEFEQVNPGYVGNVTVDYCINIYLFHKNIKISNESKKQ